MNHTYNFRDISFLEIFILFCLVFIISGYLCYKLCAQDYTNEQIADAIYKTEGGDRAKVPYGVLSIKTNDPRGVCINTIKKQRIRHKKHDCNSDFITCLGNRYCPVSSDSKGNKNWVKNVKYFLNRNNKGK